MPRIAKSIFGIAGQLGVRNWAGEGRCEFPNARKWRASTNEINPANNTSYPPRARVENRESAYARHMGLASRRTG